jgi:hypothetical protein
MKNEFPSTDKQAKIDNFFQLKAAAEQASKAFVECWDALDDYSSTVAEAIRAGRDLTDDQKAFLSDSGKKEKIQLFIQSSNDRNTNVGIFRDTEKQLRASESADLRQLGWQRVEEKIAKCTKHMGRITPAVLHNFLFALSQGPMSGVDGSMGVQFSNGKKEHYMVPDFLDTHGLVVASNIFGQQNKNGSVLSEVGAEMLDCLNQLHGKSDWENEQLRTPALDAQRLEA